MSKNIDQKNAERNQTVGEAVSKTEEFFQNYRKTIIYSTIGLVAAIGIIVAVQYLWLIPLKKEAVNQTYVAEQLFRADNFEAALNGDGNALGFAQVIKEYGSKAGSIVYFYAGVCELQLGNYESSIDYLKRYKGDDKLVLARAKCCIGDAYAGLENYKQAHSNYVNAAKMDENPLAASYLLKAGIIAEEMGDKDQALAHYQIIKEKYPQTIEGYEIDKYISRVKISK